jgi:uncharacterized protein (TIGR03089 family)
VTTPSDLLAAQLRRDGTRPLLTYYDDASGERVELSVATTANWVAKTANHLVDELGVDEGDTVSVLLPLHWQAAVVLLASWAAGAGVSFDPGGLVTFSTDPDAGADSTVVLSLAPMGADFARLVAAQPDAFVALSPAGADLVEAAPIDVPNGARILTVLPYDATHAVEYALIAPLAVDGSIVMVRNADAAALSSHASAERVTHTLGVAIDGVPRLD